jgi:diguanylate cyclase (GGDEF)-like protein
MPWTLANDVLNSLTAHVAVLNSQGFIILVNDAWKRFARENGCVDEKFYVGQSYMAVCDIALRHDADEAAGPVCQHLYALLRGEGDSFSYEYPCHSPDEERWFVVRMTRFVRENSTYLVVAHEDITARYQAEALLRQAKAAIEMTNSELQQALSREQAMARTDSLTGVSNRRHFFDLAAREFAVAQRYGNPLSILLMDLDHFKNVNDTLGHQAGDEVLKSFAQITGEHLRDTDIFARYGGEEFIALLPNTHAKGAHVVAENIRNGIALRSINTGKGHVNVTISIGVADLLLKEDTLEHLIHCADQALYTAKMQGRNRTVLFSV